MQAATDCETIGQDAENENERRTSEGREEHKYTRGMDNRAGAQTWGSLRRARKHDDAI